MSDTLPLSIQNNRRMEKWIRFEPDRTVRLAVGKVELGQGNVTALAQIAADELDVELERIVGAVGRYRGCAGRRPDHGRASRSRCRAVRCGWSRRSCAPACWIGWRSG